MIRSLPLVALSFALTACSAGNNPSDAQADRLDNAADQSTPEAAEVLHDQADAIREDGATGSAGAPGSSVQRAIERGGAAQVEGRAAVAAAAAPPSKQAMPHGAEGGAPPPKTDTKG